MATRKTRSTEVSRKLHERAMSYPHVTLDFPWGHRAFKVNGKMFAVMNEEDGLTFTLKLTAGRDFALSLPGSEPTRYGLGKHGWVTLRPTGKMKIGALYALLDESYRNIAPKRMVRELDAKM